MNSNQDKYTIPFLVSRSIQNFPHNPALVQVDGNTLTYKELNQKIQSLIAFFEKLEIKKGDKVAILGSNSPNWGITYLCCSFMGVVVVPLLPDYAESEVEKILAHSETKTILISKNLLYKIKGIEFSGNTILLEDFKLFRPTESAYNYLEDANAKHAYKVDENDLAAIIYTSGTTGTPKGVMLSHKNITFTATKGGVIQPITPNDRFLSILPLSHTYENTLGFILPLISGASIFYLEKAPTPAILLPALQIVKPTMMLTVPLIIEKIYRHNVLPKFQSSWLIKKIYAVGFFRKGLHYLAGKKLKKTFGGQIKFYGIGGAKLDATVEKFLIEARFPYAIGYGLTETSPLLAGCSPSSTKWQSTGPVLQGVELKIENPDANTGEGEIWARGNNIMMGYYKQPELTATLFDKDGWMRTGDLGVLDKDHFLFIKGRLKNVIIRNNGENVYPEEIETVINNFKHVDESIVMENSGRLVALVYFNKDEIAAKYFQYKTEFSDYMDKKIEELKSELTVYVNKRVGKYSHLQEVISQDVPFDKTATKKIKRFLYTE